MKRRISIDSVDSLMPYALCVMQESVLRPYMRLRLWSRCHYKCFEAFFLDRSLRYLLCLTYKVGIERVLKLNLKIYMEIREDSIHRKYKEKIKNAIF